MEDLKLVLLNGRQNLTRRQQQMFAHLVLKSLGAVNRPGQEMFGWRTQGEVEQDSEELAQILFSQTV